MKQRLLNNIKDAFMWGGIWLLPQFSLTYLFLLFVTDTILGCCNVYSGDFNSVSLAVYWLIGALAITFVLIIAGILYILAVEAYIIFRDWKNRRKEPLYVIDPYDFRGFCITVFKDGKHCAYDGLTLKEIRKRENNPRLKAVRWKVVCKYLDKFHKSLCTPFEEITEEQYWDWLECVPSKRRRGNRFFVGECYTANIYRFCFQLGDKYYSALRPIALTDEQLDKEINDFSKTLNADESKNNQS